jgi:hypothetical protein
MPTCKIDRMRMHTHAYARGNYALAIPAIIHRMTTQYKLRIRIFRFLLFFSLECRTSNVERVLQTNSFLWQSLQ